MSQRNIAEEAVRARKLLAKDGPVRLQSSVTLDAILHTANDPQVGENAVILIVGPNQTYQYTICRPIGLTDLDADEWTIMMTNHVSPTLARSGDPNKAKVDRQRSILRTELAVGIGLLSKKEVDDKVQIYYPKGVELRSSILAVADSQRKMKVSQLKAELKALPKVGSDDQRQKLSSEIQRFSDLIPFLKEQDQIDERALRKWWNSPAVEQEISEKFPYTHRTLTGPFGDRDQVKLIGVKGKPLADVVGAIAKSLGKGTIGGLSATKTPPTGNTLLKEEVKPATVASALKVLKETVSPKGKK